MIINVIATGDDGKTILIPCTCDSLVDFYRGFYTDFENAPPVFRRRYSMHHHYQSGYQHWKRQNPEKLRALLLSKRTNSQI